MQYRRVITSKFPSNNRSQWVDYYQWSIKKKNVLLNSFNSIWKKIKTYKWSNEIKVYLKREILKNSAKIFFYFAEFFFRKSTKMWNSSAFCCGIFKKKKFFADFFLPIFFCIGIFFNIRYELIPSNFFKKKFFFAKFLFKFQK